MLKQTEHDYRDLVYRVRVVLIAEIIDSATREVVLSGPEEEVKRAYRTLKKRE